MLDTGGFTRQRVKVQGGIFCPKPLAVCFPAWCGYNKTSLGFPIFVVLSIIRVMKSLLERWKVFSPVEVDASSAKVRSNQYSTRRSFIPGPTCMLLLCPSDLIMTCGNIMLSSADSLYSLLRLGQTLILLRSRCVYFGLVLMYTKVHCVFQCHFGSFSSRMLAIIFVSNGFMNYSCKNKYRKCLGVDKHPRIQLWRRQFLVDAHFVCTCVAV